MWKHVAEWGRPHMAIWRMCIECWINNNNNNNNKLQLGCNPVAVVILGIYKI